MVGLASVLVCAYFWPKTCLPEIRLRALSERRGAFVSSYQPARSAKLRIVENLGTYGLGNPYGTYFFPAGSGESRIWIVDNRDQTGHLVYQSWHRNYTTTDWILPLVKRTGKERLLGTINRLVLGRGFRIKGWPNKQQLATLSTMQPYIRVEEGHVIDAGEFYVQMLSPTTEKAGLEYHCMPKGPSAFNARPPIVPAEAQFMGIKIEKPWTGRADYSIETWSG